MSDHAPGSFVDFPGVILLSFQGDTKLIIFTRGEKKSTDCVSLFVEENANFFPNTEATCVAQRRGPTAGEAVLTCQSVYTQIWGRYRMIVLLV